VQVVEGGDSGWRTSYQQPPPGSGAPWLRDGLGRPAFKGQAAYIIPPIAPIAAGPGGLAYFPGTGLSPKYRGRFFLTHWNTGPGDSGIRAYALKPAGAGFMLEESQPFVTGTMATDVTFGPDSRLYFSDWVSAWPWPKSGRGRVYAVAPSGAAAADLAAAAQTRGLLADGMARRSLDELALYLGHADQRIRLNAQFELAARGEPAFAVFEGVVGNASAPRLARVHAIWGLGQLAGRVPAALNQFPALLADKDVEVRAQTARVVGDQMRIEAYRSNRAWFSLPRRAWASSGIMAPSPP
jgi:quinoprotein glucose dehydrogenase